MKQSTHSPLPSTGLWNWQLDGLCRGMDSSVFFHPEGERGRARIERENKAKLTCQSCPVIEQCREHALNIAEPYGVWGGLTESERVSILGRRAKTMVERV